MEHGAALGEKTLKRKRRRVPGTRANQACVNCKAKKLKCDDQLPDCTNCSRFSLACLVEDPATKQHRPRNYLRTLEERVAVLESADHVHLSTPSDNASPPAGWSTAAARDDGHSSEKSDLPSRLGFLDVTTANREEPQYLGSSSAFSFAHIINSSLRSSVPGMVSVGGGRAADMPDHAPSPCPLPEYTVAMTLSNAYFENIHPQYPFLHEPTFRRHETRILTSPEASTDVRLDHAPLFFLNMVYATGALLLPNMQRLAERFYASAQLYQDILSRNSLEAIQGLLCYAMYSLRSQSGPSLWKLSGLALRQCIELGYHRRNRRPVGDRDVLQLELRKRAFWCAQGIDCAYAMRLGRPLGVQLFEVDAELPMDIDDSSLSLTGVHGSPRSGSSGAPTSMSNAIHVIRLRRLWARMHASACSASAPADTEGSARPSDTTTAQLRADLEEWLRTAPQSPPRAGATLSIFATKEWYECNYSHTILQLYRVRLAEDKGATTHGIFMDCVAAASSLCHAYRRLYIGTQVKYTWATLHCVFLAGLTYLHCLWTSAAAREEVSRDEVVRTCTDCTMVLVAIAEGWGAAAPYRDIFETLASRTMSMVLSGMMPAGQQRSNEQPAGGGTADSPQRDVLADWMADFDSAGMLSGFDDLLSGFMNDFAPWDDHHEETGWAARD